MQPRTVVRFQDRVAQVSDVGRLVGIDAGVLDDHVAELRRELGRAGREAGFAPDAFAAFASVLTAPAPAAAAIPEKFAGFLGIYGQCVVLDHGMGVQSLYAHLSSVTVEVGDRVEDQTDAVVQKCRRHGVDAVLVVVLVGAAAYFLRDKLPKAGPTNGGAARPTTAASTRTRRPASTRRRPVRSRTRR